MDKKKKAEKPKDLLIEMNHELIFLKKLLAESKQHQLAKLNSLYLSELLVELQSCFLSYRKNLALPKSVTFGLEIEFENASFLEVEKSFNQLFKSQSGTKWFLTTDLSVQSLKFGKFCGGEIQSLPLKDEDASWLTLENVCQMLLDLKATADRKSGGHLHLGSQILGKNQSSWVNLIKLWTIYEKLIYRFSYGEKMGGRKGLLYQASPISKDLFYLLPKLEKEKDLKEFIKILKSSASKSINFNYVSSYEYAKRNTIELRCPNGSLNPVIWQNNVNFFSKMFLYCQSNSYDEDFINYKLNKYSFDDYNFNLYNEIYLEDALELSDLIFTNNLDKLYFLKQYFKEMKSPRKMKDNSKTIKLTKS